jgi:hypothetical protein
VCSIVQKRERMVCDCCELYRVLRFAWEYAL